MGSCGNSADAFTFRELGEDCIHCVADELLACHSLGGRDVDDVKIRIKEEDGI